MAQTFGWKSAGAVLLNATLATYVLRERLLAAAPEADAGGSADSVPLAIIAVHAMENRFVRDNPRPVRDASELRQLLEEAW